MVDLTMNLDAINPGRILTDQCHIGRDRGRTRIDENEVIAWHDVNRRWCRQA
ncbi:hypothetical protein R69776_08112 [Paraburkholderia nemoris]|uniref:Uncharacterized protein n=1 Tax=Paraburkholderia nemoris TaxID=2793076 RepID=A0ABN7NG89_9BURK|nr:hypothetical protein R69776_08112 [Paraburkholderia nemoris]